MLCMPDVKRRAFLLLHAINSLINHVEAEYSNLSLIIISVAILVKVALGLYFRRMGKKTNSEALKGSGTDALFDSAVPQTP